MKSTIESIQYWLMQHGTAENVSSVGMIIVIVLLIVSIYKMLKSFHPTMGLFVLGIWGVSILGSQPKRAAIHDTSR